jgi:hypothetical protein
MEKINNKVVRFNIKFDLPKFANKINPIAVYKITFDDKWFYIGSSIKIKDRFSNWVGVIKYGGTHNNNMEKILPLVSNIKFEILQEGLGLKDIRNKENLFIAENYNHPYCLNHSPNSTNLKGAVRNKWKVEPIKIKKNPLLEKKVARISMNGDVIKIYSNIRFARRDGYIGIMAVLTGKTISRNGFKFRFVNEDGSIDNFKRDKKITVLNEYQKIINSKRLNEIRHLIKNSGPKGKPIFAINKKTGNTIKYKNINSACDELGFYKTGIRYVIKGKWNQYNGYFFKYAD